MQTSRIVERVPAQPAPEARARIRSDGGRRLLRRVALGVAVTDAACIAGSLALAYQLRFGLTALTADYGLVLAAAPAAWLVVFALYRLFEAHRLTPEEEFRRALSAGAVGMGLLVMTSYWSAADFSRIWLGLTCIFAAIAELSTRSAWRQLRRRATRDGRIALRTLIVGSGGETSRLTRALGTPGLGFVVVGSLEPAGPSPHGTTQTIVALRRAVADQRAECIFVASGGVGADAVCEIARLARHERIELLVASRLPEVLTTRLTVQRVGRTMAVSVLPPRLTRSQMVIKRAFDLAVASLLLVVTAPLWLLIAVAVRVSSQGPALFRQERATSGGRTFRMAKFRTMVHGADLISDPSVAFFKLAEDPRVTRIGRFLRRWSLDELPQLLNVLRGDMSLVGPRPLPVEQVRADPDLLTARLEVPAGMSGWWQISGRSDLATEEAVRLDIFYIENWSLAYDLYVLIRTAGAVLGRRGAV